MPRALLAGLVYFVAVFAVGFVLGTLRVLVLVPALGEMFAVLLELPVMLAASWMVCGLLLRRFRVPAEIAARALMGATAFALLIGAEVALGIIGFGQTLAQIAAAWLTPVGALGLAGQIVFGLFPLVRRA